MRLRRLWRELTSSRMWEEETEVGAYTIKVFDDLFDDLDDVIVFDPDPASHVDNIRALFQRLREHNLKRSPAK